MTGLNDNYKRRILTSLQYADKLLEDGLHALAPGARPVFSGFVQDLSAAEARCVDSYARKIREQMVKLLARCHIELSIPAIPSSGKIRTGLNSMDLTLEDIYPEKMRGYGKMDAAAARDLSWNLQEIRRLINLLLSFLSESGATQRVGPDPMQLDPDLSELRERIGSIISNYGLVEFLPAMNAFTREINTHRFEIGIFGRDDTGKSFFINHLLEPELPSGPALGAIPIRIMIAARPQVRITFLDRVEDHSWAQLAAFATEAGNPRNAKRVVAVEASMSSTILPEGMALFIMPPCGCLSFGGQGFAREFLPELDFGLVLINGRSAPGHEDASILKALAAAGIPSAIWISHCDRLSPAELAAAQVSIRNAMTSQLGRIVEVFPNSMDSSTVTGAKAWFERMILPLRQQSRTAFAASIEGKIRSLQASVLSTLESSGGFAAADGNQIGQPDDILRHMDECWTAFQQHWEKEFDRMAGWAGGILDQAVSALVRETPVADPVRGFTSDQVVEAIMSAITTQLQPFLKQYRELSGRIGADLVQLKAIMPSAGVFAQELPVLSSMPAPILSFLGEATIQPPGTLARASQAARLRYLRKELEEKFAIGLRLMLEELQPRFIRWFMTTANALKEGLRMQTDPIRFRSPGPPIGCSSDNLIRDIEFLRKG